MKQVMKTLRLHCISSLTKLFEKKYYLYISCQKWAAIKKLIALALQIDIFGRRNDVVYEKHKLKKA